MGLGRKVGPHFRCLMRLRLSCLSGNLWCMTTKHCNGCSRDKDLDGGFYKGQSRCKECKKADHDRWVERNKEHLAAYKQKWFEEHREQTKVSKKKYYQTHKPEVAAAGRLLRYGLSEENFEAMLSAQGGHCAICGTDTPHGRGAWHVDHDHLSKKVRGLLCTGCNLGIGHLQDDVGILRAAISYLERSATRLLTNPVNVLG